MPAGADASADVAGGDHPDPSSHPPREGWGRLLAIAAALAIVALLGAMVLLVIGNALLGGSGPSSATRLREIEIDTGIASTNDDPDHAPQYDIKLGVCEARGRGVRAGGTIINPTDAPADYRVWLVFRESGPGASGAEFGSAEILVQNVPEHSTTNWEALASARPEGAFACRIVRIDRVPAPASGGS